MVDFNYSKVAQANTARELLGYTSSAPTTSASSPSSQSSAQSRQSPQSISNTFAPSTASYGGDTNINITPQYETAAPSGSSGAGVFGSISPTMVAIAGGAILIALTVLVVMMND
ncbi:MAG: hypothetical protein PHQ43_09700 [Dehalococcoidales bacterium]|nr:hypothetical protein [Dehalococcoidales bacterium]